MKKILSVFVMVTALIAVSCKSTGDTSVVDPQEQVKINDTFESVYGEYRDDIILEGAQQYVVKPGDYLSRIALNFYGPNVVNADYFPLIMLASPGVVADPELIEPGDRLTIPNLDRNLTDPTARGEIKKFLKDIAYVYDQKIARGERNRELYDGFRNRLTALSDSL
ncbi:hypothetical protein FACS1894163_10350 [Spirochaetia bacterium]|nr:hypothetical protein FACS1894163_10350 [Spirochaetia bacterium]